jgi:hypothetical protein
MEHKLGDVSTGSLILPSPTGKRNHDLMISASVESSDQSLQSPKSARLDLGHSEFKAYDCEGSLNHEREPESLAAHVSYPPGYERAGVGTLTDRQRSFIQQWHQSFAAHQRESSPANESINALATLVQSPPQSIRNFLNTEYRPLGNAAIKKPLSSLVRTSETEMNDLSRTTYTLKEANRHLSSQTLTLVEKYVSSCRRRRAQKDGRRSLNEGPLMCTYGCGYRTKRAFDWKRHEETHEPQELWLCHLCRTNEESNPFLVNRRDKFLRHVKDAHKKWEPENVLDMSKVDFEADFQPKCHLCSEVSRTWDDRCRHVLGHYEDGTQRDARKSRVRERGFERERSRSDDNGTGPHTRHPSSDSTSDQSSLRPEITDDDNKTL